MSTRPLLVRAGVLAGSVLALGAATWACSGTSGTSATPVPPAIVVRASDALRGLGCGAGANDVYRYAAYATGANGATLGLGVYDCFADATFVATSAVPFGTPVTIDLFLYTRAAFDAKSSSIEDARLAGARPDGTNPTWTSRCSAVFLPDVETFASCGAPAGPTGDADAGAGEARVVVDLGSFANDGGALTCGVAYTRVRGSYTSSAQVGVTTPVEVRPCTESPLTIAPADPLSDYVIDLELLGDDDPDGGAPVVVATTTCRATTSPGLTSTAACDAAR